MARTAEEFLAALQGNLPLGPAWPRHPDAVLTKILRAWADESARVDKRNEDLFAEGDPRTAFELMAEWEAFVGLPDACAEAEDTLAERREAVIAKLTMEGGQSPAYLVDLALAHGYEITIEEFQAFTTESGCDEPIYGDAWAFTWAVHAPQVTERYLDCESTCDERLAKWGNDRLECVLAAVAPKHTNLLFAYGS